MVRNPRRSSWHCSLGPMGTHIQRLQGRFMDDGYTAMNGTTPQGREVCMGYCDPEHPIMAGYWPPGGLCDCFHVPETYLALASAEIGHWSDGLSFVAAKVNRTVASVNSYVGDVYIWTGQAVPYARAWGGQPPGAGPA